MHRNFHTFVLAGALVLPLAGGAAWAQTSPTISPAPLTGTRSDADTKVNSENKAAVGQAKPSTGSTVDKKARGTGKHRTDKSAHSGQHKDQTAAMPDPAKKPAQPAAPGATSEPANKY
jgi:hypothetical protein